MEKILDFKLVTLVLCMVMHTFNVNGQFTKVFYPDTVIGYSENLDNANIRYIPSSKLELDDNKNVNTSNIVDILYSSNILKLVHKFEKKINITKISVHYYDIRYRGWDIRADAFNLNQYVFQESTNLTDTTITYNCNITTDSIDVKYVYFTRIYIKNFTVFYDIINTSVDESVNTNDVNFYNNKFHTSYDIKNIKLFDISGKLIQEGDLNDSYQLEKGKLYFVLFDNKYSKKISITN